MTADRALVALDDVPDIAYSDQAAAEQPPHTWQPANLLELAANPPAPPTIGGLLYPAKRTVLSGETESMKTWLALILCKAELDIGLPVGWVDLDAMGPGALLDRLRLLGVEDDVIADGFLYYEPSEMLTPEKTAQVAQTIADRGIRLFVIDAFNPILNLHGLDPNANPDIETFWRTIADPICRAGAAPVLLDHVVKNADNRGKYSTGSERKASGAIVHIGFKLLEPLTIGGRGRTLLNVHKDRPGYLQRPAVGRLVLTSNDNHISYELEPDKSHEQDGTFRPTTIMEKVSRQLERETEPLSTKQIEDIKLGKADYVRKALAALTEDGYIHRQEGTRGAILYTTIRPFTEADQPTQTTSSPHRPDVVPDLTSRHVVPRPLPPGDEDDVRRRPGTTSTSSPTPGQPIHEYDRPPIDESTAPDPDQDEPWWHK